MLTQKSQLDSNNLNSYLKYGCEAARHQPRSLTLNCTVVKQCDNSLYQIGSSVLEQCDISRSQFEQMVKKQGDSSLS
jgi:hypothetical protein